MTDSGQSPGLRLAHQQLTGQDQSSVNPKFHNGFAGRTSAGILKSPAQPPPLLDLG